MRTIRWALEEGQGIEHLVFNASEDGFAIESVLVGERDGTTYGLHYEVRCDAQWRTTFAWLKIVGGGEMELHGDGAGRWRDAQGRVLSAIEGCIDIDISATPFTNTLSIRRLQLAEGERQQVSVAYISAPDLQVTRAEQVYSCIALNREYRFESLVSKFTADLPVDEDGLVIDYPTLSTRLPPAS